uniref:Uncharacterized protein n=1 Tax=Attheya septentrionalis TaxID=420275 RepID=A0A7S2XRH0_9STRA|mmetsp:Transcript_5029/g.8840  ORF Transcript_5029/g.8840 Transcript_5029/m.8840 type:complete len:133 (+) Transcript_5029:43-441(+)|eukprot:CAMPEP_0198289688 /NCGR_PEP_ID=MMETSP1449-20131203/7793_1 /TAXON_ID=420275 /ORGANISM="Attheya septentrionalis, Strain CCMP2084" /LENGTH=132 /DNA_ID=CAMNT_0043988057 /DNA_START=34 /DNA_END=432 /DNA_ORIENTATION=+
MAELRSRHESTAASSSSAGGVGDKSTDVHDISGAVVDVACALTDVVTATGEKALEVNEKHHVTERTADAVKEYNRQNHVLERAKQAATSAYQQVVKFEAEHHVVEQILKKTAAGARLVAEKIRECGKDNTLI